MPDLGPHLFLFDVDGTLVRLEGAGRRALAQALGAVFSVTDPIAVMKPIPFDGRTDRSILRDMMRRAGIDPSVQAAHREAFDEAYLDALASLLAETSSKQVLPGVIPLLETLASRAGSLGLLTGNTEAGARAKLRPFGLNRFFPSGAFGSDHEDRIVLADLARRRMETRGGRTFASHQVYVIGDSVMDIRCGKAHGFRTVAVTTGWTSAESLSSERPDLLLEDLTGFLPSLNAA